MRFLFFSTNYRQLLNWFCKPNPGLESQPYEKQKRARAERLFSLADFDSSNLRNLGHEVWEIYANNENEIHYVGYVLDEAMSVRYSDTVP